MEILVLLVLAFLLLVPPFFIGFSVESRLNGIVVMSILPALISIVGIVAYLDAESSSDEETRSWSFIALALPLLAIGALVVALIPWAIGRAWARRKM